VLDSRYVAVLRRLYERLTGTRVNWAVTASCNLALQGLPVEVHDIDIQSDVSGVYAIEELFAGCVSRPWSFSASGRIRSHFGALTVEGIKVEIMADVEKQGQAGEWAGECDWIQHVFTVPVDGMPIPVLSLDYELRAYAAMGREAKARLIEQWLADHAFPSSRPDVL